MNTLKRLVVLCVVLLFSGGVFAKSFLDVEESDWFYSYVEMASSGLGMFTGYPDGTFRPEKNITRAELAVVLVRLFGLDAEPCSDAPYPDVSPDAWYCPYVAAIKSAGISDVPVGENYRPEDEALRLDVVVMLEMGIATLYPVNFGGCEESPFVDVPVDEYFCSYVQAAKQQGVVSGYPDGTFRPFATVTRAEIATMFDRVAEEIYSSDRVVNIGDYIFTVGVFKKSNLVVKKFDQGENLKFIKILDLAKLSLDGNSTFVIRAISSDGEQNIYLYGFFMDDEGLISDPEEALLLKFSADLEVEEVVRVVDLTPDEDPGNFNLDFQRIDIMPDGLVLQGPGKFVKFDNSFEIVNKFKLWSGIDFYQYLSTGKELYMGLNSLERWDPALQKGQNYVWNNYSVYSVFEDVQYFVVTGYCPYNGTSYGMGGFYGFLSKEDFSFRAYRVDGFSTYYDGGRYVAKDKEGNYYFLFSGMKEESTGEEGFVILETWNNGVPKKLMFVKGFDPYVIGSNLAVVGDKVFIGGEWNSNSCLGQRGVIVLDMTTGSSSAFSYFHSECSVDIVMFDDFNVEEISNNFSLQDTFWVPDREALKIEDEVIEVY